MYKDFTKGSVEKGRVRAFSRDVLGFHKGLKRGHNRVYKGV